MSLCIGIVVVGHDRLAEEMVAATCRIMPDARGIIAVSINSNAPVDAGREKIRQAIAEVGGSGGTLLLTDMFGGTPTNLCLSFLQPGSVEVISGVNLPMLIKLVHGQQTRPFTEVVEFIQHYGQKNIVIASRVLEGQIENR